MALVPLQQADPMRYKAWIESSQQPQAQLNETQASTAAAGASAAHTEQEMQIAQQTLNQQNFLKQAQSTFDKAKSKNGYVDPNLYNSMQQQAAALNIDSNAFDSKFAGPFTDPNNINYNTPDGKATQAIFGETKRQIDTLISRYNSIPQDQKGLLSKSSVGNIPGVGAALEQKLAPDAYTYEQGRQGLAANLKSIAGGGAGSGVRVTQTELNQWSNLLPSIGDTPDVAQKKMTTLDSLIKAKFNSPVGLNTPSTGGAAPTQGQTQGGGNILQNAGNDVKGMVNGILNVPASALQAGQQFQQQTQGMNPLQQGLAGIVGNANLGLNVGKGIANEYNQTLGQPLQGGDILGRILSHAQAHPVNTALDVLPFLAAAKGATAGEAVPEAVKAADAGAQGADAASVVKMPNKLMQILNPQATINAGADIKNMAIQTAEAAGKTVDGDSIVSAMNDWRKTALQANPGEISAAKINDIADGVIKNFSGQKVAPSVAHDIYNEVDSGFTRAGVTKENIQGSADQALRQSLRKSLDEAAPGFDKGVSTQAKGFQAKKGPLGDLKKNLPYKVAGAGMGLVGLDALRHILGL